MTVRLVQLGLHVVLGLGWADEQEPWAVFVESENGKAFVCIVRLNGTIILANVTTKVVYNGADVRDITDQKQQHAHSLIETGKVSDLKVVMHPSSIFAAFVAAALLLAGVVLATEPAEAAIGQDRTTQDNAVAETKDLFLVIFDELMSRNVGWMASDSRCFAAASLIATAGGCIFMIDDHEQPSALAADATPEHSMVAKLSSPPPRHGSSVQVPKSSENLVSTLAFYLSGSACRPIVTKVVNWVLQRAQWGADRLKAVS